MMKTLLGPLATGAAILLLAVPLAQAQTPSTQSAPSLLDAKLIDGPVKSVDPAAKTVQVGWLFGLLSTTLEVNDDTTIAVDGMKSSLEDIREGASVKASYEARNGKNIAKAMEVESPEAPEAATLPSTRSPRGMESPGGATAPPAGGKGTP
jgi:Cu/Ag efflux protein CusF